MTLKLKPIIKQLTKMKFIKGIFFSLMILGLIACENGPQEPDEIDNFDREAMLANWADNIIVPGYIEFAGKTSALKNAGEVFAASPEASKLSELRTAFVEAYESWQRVSMFAIGKAEEVLLRDYLNIYPTDVADLIENIEQGGYNLELPSEYDQQGFPALDYLLYGVGETEEEVLTTFTNASDGEKYKVYLLELVNRIDALTQEVLQDWQKGYRDEFVNNSGNSATASVDRMVNDFLFYYEKHLRAGKVGIPAGVFSGSPQADLVEAPYLGDNRAFLLTALGAVQDFFNGKAHQNGQDGQGLDDYLAYLSTTKDEESLAKLINEQFDAARTAIEALDPALATQVETDNVAMLSAYDQLQLNVVLLKVDMLQALNINVDFVDADGD